MRLRVMTWNVHGMRAGPWAVARVVREAEPDALLVQEYGFRLPLRVLARLAGMRLLSHHPSRRPFQRNAILVRPASTVLRAWAVELPSTPARDGRGAFLAEFAREGVRLVLGSVHLGLKDRERVEHARLLADELERTGLPFVLGGDLNESPDGPAATLLSARFEDVLVADGGATPTYPAGRPAVRIDFLFAGGGARALTARVHDDDGARRASDHLPASALIEVGAT